MTYVWPSTNPFPRTLACGLFKIPGFSGRRYFNHLVPTPFFWDTAPSLHRTHTIPTATPAIPLLADHERVQLYLCGWLYFVSINHTFEAQSNVSILCFLSLRSADVSRRQRSDVRKYVCASQANVIWAKSDPSFLTE